MSMRDKEESRRMQGSPTNEEVERSATFYLYHPCSLLEQALGALFKCLGFELGTNKKEHGMKPPSASEEENSARNEHASPQEVPTSTPSFEFISNVLIRRGPRRSDLSRGSGPGIN